MDIPKALSQSSGTELRDEVRSRRSAPSRTNLGAGRPTPRVVGHSVPTHHLRTLARIDGPNTEKKRNFLFWATDKEASCRGGPPVWCQNHRSTRLERLGLVWVPCQLPRVATTSTAEEGPAGVSPVSRNVRDDPRTNPREQSKRSMSPGRSKATSLFDQPRYDCSGAFLAGRGQDGASSRVAQKVFLVFLQHK